MEIQYQNVYEQLKKKKINIPELNLFNNRGIAIRILHWQPKGTLRFNENQGFVCQEKEHKEKAAAFVKLLLENKVDIGIAPEYCFPWEELENIFSNKGMRPPKGKLWCLGMEGISSQMFEDFMGRTELSSDIHIISEDMEVVNLNKFFSCLVYLFMAANKLICVIQFKTTAASDQWMELESQGLSCGNIIYYFKDEKTNHCLFSFICADALHQEINNIKKEVNYQNCIILHPQLNPKPLHETFSQMRRNFLDYSQNAIKMISVNWTKGTIIKFDDRAKDIKILESYSACYYSKKIGEDVLNRLILANKSKGMNMTKDGRTYIWHMPDNEHCMQYLIDCFENNLLSISAGRHNEPRADKYYEISDENSLWVSGNACGRCNIDWQWLREEFGIEQCTQDDCAVLKLHKFFSILFGGQFSDNVGRKKGSIIFQQDDELQNDVIKKRERGEFINKALKAGNVPAKFKEIKKCNYKWILDDMGNFIIEENREPICVVYADSKKTIIIERRIMDFKQLMGEAALDRMLLYCLTEDGIQYYEEFYNTEINDPNLTHTIESII